MLGRDQKYAFAIEHPGDTTDASQSAAGDLEDLADFAGRAVAVFGEDVAEHGHAARAVAFVDHLGVGLVASVAAPLFDRSLDIVLGHTGLAGLVDRVPQREV